MEPKLSTDPKLYDILGELRQLECELHYPARGKTRVDFEALMDQDFWEVGASGRAYSKAFVLGCLEKRSQESVEVKTDHFNCFAIAPECYLLTYVQIENGRTTRRSAIWRRLNDRWKNLYHQGTVLTQD